MSDPSDLHALLGLPPGTNGERLRVAYEGAVRFATQRGDWQRAHQLSAAFDALAAPVRHSVYPGHGQQASRWASDTSRTSARRRRAGRARRAASSGRHLERAARDAALTARWQMRRPYRIVAGLLVALVVATFAASSLTQPSRHAEWAWGALIAGCPVYGWLNFTVVGRQVRRRLGQAFELLVWSFVAAMVGVIVVLAVAGARR